MSKKILENGMENGMKVASAIYHLDAEGDATKQALKEHPLLKNISRKRLESALKTLLDFGVIQIRLIDSKTKTYAYSYSITYPETIEQYMKSKGWLTINKTFKFEEANKNETKQI